MKERGDRKDEKEVGDSWRAGSWTVQTKTVGSNGCGLGTGRESNDEALHSRL